MSAKLGNKNIATTMSFYGDAGDSEIVFSSYENIRERKHDGSYGSAEIIENLGEIKIYHPTYTQHQKMSFLAKHVTSGFFYIRSHFMDMNDTDYWSEEAFALEHLKKEASKKGANAIILLEFLKIKGNKTGIAVARGQAVVIKRDHKQEE